ncbi:MAG: hypothetical protein RMJ98_08970 [Myxococcales bacterium]|nr:hypothetical protein [Polyangiaceae bacterium]MDW8249417.1 hypothetical protein [Myxococcales bacterium]
MDKDWYGTPVPWEVSWVAACSPEELLFGAVVEAPARCEEGAGFREGLWTHDVLELFVPCLRTTLHAARGEPRYLELNLAPSGAWWACLFEGYRIRCPRQPFPCEVRVWSTRREGSWSAALALPLAPIGISLDLPRLRFCAILGEPRRYLIHGISPGGTPDFHRQVLSTTE